MLLPSPKQHFARYHAHYSGAERLQDPSSGKKNKKILQVECFQHVYYSEAIRMFFVSVCRYPDTPVPLFVPCLPCLHNAICVDPVPQVENHSLRLSSLNIAVATRTYSGKCE